MNRIPTVFFMAVVNISMGSFVVRLRLLRTTSARMVNAPESNSTSTKTQIIYRSIVMLWLGFWECTYIITLLRATTAIPMSTSSDDQAKYFVSEIDVPFIQSFDSKGLNMFMNAMANADTKSTMSIWCLFSSIYWGTFLKSVEEYSIISFIICPPEESNGGTFKQTQS